MLESIRQRVRGNILEMVGGGSGPPVAFLTPPGDPGLFGPNSMVWRVHADFISMMIGGISSLTLQALHPQALAGVWDHSTFRQDLKGRLGRTAFFIAATTYGPTEMANKIIDKVNDVSNIIASSIEEQAVVTNEIGKTISESAERSVEISENINEVSSTSVATTMGAIQTNNAASELASMASELQALVNQFKVNE